MHQHRLLQTLVCFPYHPEVTRGERWLPEVALGDMVDGKTLETVVGDQILTDLLVALEFLAMQQADDRSHAVPFLGRLEPSVDRRLRHLP